MKLWVVFFLLLLAVGIAFGISRDLYSRETGRMSGIVVAAKPGGSGYKSPVIEVPSYSVRLADGRVVEAAAARPLTIPVGGAITVTELVTPWGQVWYRHSN